MLGIVNKDLINNYGGTYIQTFESSRYWFTLSHS